MNKPDPFDDVATPTDAASTLPPSVGSMRVSDVSDLTAGHEVD